MAVSTECPDGGARQRIGRGGGYGRRRQRALSEVETTVLLDMDEGQEAIRKPPQRPTGRQASFGSSERRIGHASEHS
jgi:hypothetical protein